MFICKVKNHGIAADLVDGVFSEVAKFFALPLEEKVKIRQDANDRGYVPPFEEKLDVRTKKGDSKERINFGLEVSHFVRLFVADITIRILRESFP